MLQLKNFEMSGQNPKHCCEHAAAFKVLLALLPRHSTAAHANFLPTRIPTYLNGWILTSQHFKGAGVPWFEKVRYFRVNCALKSLYGSGHWGALSSISTILRRIPQHGTKVKVKMAHHQFCTLNPKPSP